MIIQLDIGLRINAEFDTETQDVRITSCVPIIKKKDEEIKTEKHTLSDTEIKYKILTLGAGFAKTYGMEANDEINIYVNGEKYSQPVMTHKSTLGRIDGLTDFNKRFGIFMEDYERGDERVTIEVSYNPIEKVLNIITDKQSIFTPQQAVTRAMQKYSPGSTFSLPELYADEWTLPRGYAGVFGKNFYNFVTSECRDKIGFVCVDDSGTARYKLK